MWVCGRVTSSVMCERQSRYGLSLGGARFGLIAETHTYTHRKHSSAQSPSGDIGSTVTLLVACAGNPLSNFGLLINTTLQSGS